ncbi:hypothetical protein AB0P17_36655 [Streptomyces sp. NPDC088124]|uniref:hypothetical protein n=1 Tax=Streptomyces sp. NPDC088124 TaxID=3154654 RepID=UPI0034281B1E
MVRMQHSALPEGQDIEVADVSVSAYERMGWTVVGDRPPSEPETPTADGRRQTPKEK